MPGPCSFFENPWQYGRLGTAAASIELIANARRYLRERGAMWEPGWACRTLEAEISPLKQAGQVPAQMWRTQKPAEQGQEDGLSQRGSGANVGPSNRVTQEDLPPHPSRKKGLPAFACMKSMIGTPPHAAIPFRHLSQTRPLRGRVRFTL